MEALQDTATDIIGRANAATSVMQIAGIPLFLKSYRPCRLRDKWLFRLGLDKALKAYDNASNLRAIDALLAPEPIALFSCSRPPASVLIAEALQAGGTIARWMRAERGCVIPVEAHKAPGINEELVRQLGAFLSELHKQGIYHADLHDQNIWVRPTVTGFVFSLLDVEAVKFCRSISLKCRLKNLLRLARNIGTDAAKMELDGEALALEFAKSYFQMLGIVPAASQLEMVSASARRGRERWTEISHRICG